MVLAGRADGPRDPRARQRDHPARAARVRGLERPRASGRRSCWSSRRLLTVAPWTIRNAIDAATRFVPVSTQFGSALAGTYNSEARADKVNPASWRTLKRVDDYRPIFNQIRSTPEPVLEKQLRTASIEFIKEHPALRADGRLWTTRRMLDLGRAGLVDPHRGDDLRRPRGWADRRASICFWIFALLAIFGRDDAASASGPALGLGGSAADVPRASSSWWSRRRATGRRSTRSSCCSRRSRSRASAAALPLDAAERPGVPEPVVVRLLQPRLRVLAPALDQCAGELRREEQVAQQLAVQRVGVRVDEAAEERELRRAVRVQQAAVVAAEDVARDLADRVALGRRDEDVRDLRWPACGARRRAR